MEQNEIITALHAQLKEAAQRIFAKLDIKPGKYNAGETDKALKLSEQMKSIAALRYESRKYPATAEGNARKIDDIMINIECSGIPNETITISFDTFTASMPAALVFAKLAEWEKEFKIKALDKAVFVKEEEGETIGSCVVEFPKEAKFISEYAGTDPLRPVLMGVYLDIENGCIVASDTHVLTEMPVNISGLEGEPLKLIIDSKVIKAVAGQRCNVKLLKDEGNNISIKTDKGDVYTCNNVKGIYPNYRRVYPKVNKAGLVELTKDSVKALANFAKNTVKQTKDTRDGNVCIRIEIPAYSSTGKATYIDLDYQREKTINFTVKGSPTIDVVFGIHAFNLAIVAKNWNGCLWYLDPSRPVIFDNTNTRCTIVMPLQLLDKTAFKCGSCPGVVEALKRHNYDVAESEAAAHQQQKEKQIEAESATITRAEKEECAVRYCKIKGVKADIVTDNDEIIAVTPNGCKVRYIGRFRRSGEIVLFDKERELLSIPEPPKEEPETLQISTESAETKQVSAEEEKSGETANYRISRHSHDDYAKIIVGDRSQSKVIAILLTIDNKSYIEINDEPAGLATIGQRPLQTAKPITELTDTEILKLIYNSPQPPTEPPQNTETDERQDIPPKPKELVRIVSAAPPGPPKTIHSASGPPGFKFIITQPTINKKLKLQNHDRHNNLAPPYLHSRMLRLSRLSGGSGYDLRNLCARNPLIMPLC